MGSTLILKKFGRCGNNIVQLIHAIAYSHCNEIDLIVFDVVSIQSALDGSLVTLLSPDFELILPSGINIKFMVNPSSKLSHSVAADFWFGPGAGLQCKGGKAIDQCMPFIDNNLMRAIRKDLKYFGNILLMECRERSSIFQQRLFQKDKVGLVQLRGGDIFKSKSSPNRIVHNGFCQPPISFYFGAVKELAESWGVTKCILMHEDFNNPCLSPLSEILNSEIKDLSIETMSLNLYDTSILLLCSQYIISGQGSFSSAFAVLSSQLKGLCIFRESLVEDILPFAGADVFKIDDRDGLYTQVGSWSASDEQIDCMLNYSIDSLDFSAIKVAKSKRLRNKKRRFRNQKKLISAKKSQVLDIDGSLTNQQSRKWHRSLRGLYFLVKKFTSLLCIYKFSESKK